MVLSVRKGLLSVVDGCEQNLWGGEHVNASLVCGDSRGKLPYPALVLGF